MAHDEPRRSPRWSRRAGTVALLLAGLAVATAFWMWPRDDIPNQPDAVVVLGGVGIERAQLGIELSTRHDAALVLSSSATYFGWHLGAVCREDAICVFPDPETTLGEARAVAALAAERGWKHVTVATSRFHTTRARVLFRQCLGDRVSIVGARAEDSRGVFVYTREAIGTLAALTVRRAC